MSHRPQRTERLHALDSLRAIMMLLGLVLHSAISYTTLEHGDAWSLKDPETTSPVFDLVVAYIHAFRMPVFFAIAGFFGALLFYERSPRELLRNRLSRVVYPFLAFLFLIWPPVVFAWVYTTAAMNGSATPLIGALAALLNPLVLIPANPMHLWFLEYLVLFSFAGWLLGSVMRRLPGGSRRIRWLYELMMRSSALRPLLFAGPSFILLLLMGTPWPEKTGSFVPAWEPLLNYFTFYVFGWLLYGSRNLVSGLPRHAWALTTIATASFLVKTLAYERLHEATLTALNVLAVWSFVFGITGLFVRYFSRHSAAMRWVSDASYWFYLVHLPLTALGAGLLIGSGLPAGVKFMLVLGGTTAICLVTYAVLVRGTFVGAFLNGRRYPSLLRREPVSHTR
ncbi:MAG: acyltransferase family protein [bacterium]|nr:acyltransferase family protein [bacterium]